MPGYFNFELNINAIHLLEQNVDKIDWNILSMKKRMDVIREELMMKCMHPSRLEKLLELGGDAFLILATEPTLGALRGLGHWI